MVLDLNLVLLKTLYDCIAANEYFSFSNTLEFLDLHFLEIFYVSLVFFLVQLASLHALLMRFFFS